MHTFCLTLVLLAVSAVFVAAEPIFGVGLLALKVGIVKGALIGSALRRRGRGRKRSYRKSYRKRHGRSTEDESPENILDELFLQATLEDQDDCAKKFVCLANAKEVKSLSSLEKSVINLFGSDGYINVNDASARFQLAAAMGKLAGEDQCRSMYARCPAKYEILSKTLEDMPMFNIYPNSLNDIEGNE